MSKYEKSLVQVSSLQEGDVFEHPHRSDTICKVTHHSLKETDDGQPFGLIMYSIVEGHLHWPVIHLPEDFTVTLLLPTTTYVQLSGKDWVDSLTEHHGVKP